MISLNHMQEKIKNLINEALKNLGIEDVDFVVEHPADLKMGDYSTNIAMVLTKKLQMNPRELAEKIVAEMSKSLFNIVDKIEVAGPGFINFYLSPKFFNNSIKEIDLTNSNISNAGFSEIYGALQRNERSSLRAYFLRDSKYN